MTNSPTIIRDSFYGTPSGIEVLNPVAIFQLSSLLRGVPGEFLLFTKLKKNTWIEVIALKNKEIGCKIGSVVTTDIEKRVTNNVNKSFDKIKSLVQEHDLWGKSFLYSLELEKPIKYSDFDSINDVYLDLSEEEYDLFVIPCSEIPSLDKIISKPKTIQLYQTFSTSKHIDLSFFASLLAIPEYISRPKTDSNINLFSVTFFTTLIGMFHNLSLSDLQAEYEDSNNITQVNVSRFNTNMSYNLGIDLASKELLSSKLISAVFNLDDVDKDDFDKLFPFGDVIKTGGVELPIVDNRISLQYIIEYGLEYVFSRRKDQSRLDVDIDYPEITNYVSSMYIQEGELFVQMRTFMPNAYSYVEDMVNSDKVRILR